MSRDSDETLAVVMERANWGALRSRDSVETLAALIERAECGALGSRGVTSLPVGISVAMLL